MIIAVITRCNKKINDHTGSAKNKRAIHKR